MFKFLKHRKHAVPPSPSPASPPPPPLAYGLDVCLRSDIGCHRQINEDSGQIVRSADPASNRILIAVADGMGGHQAGEIASQRAIEVVSRAYSNGAMEDPQAGLKLAVEQANREIYEQAQISETFKGMGTTCTVLALHDGVAYSAHVGDSRLYLIRNGGIYLMTEDHSAVMELVKQGTLTLDEARHHADKNVIVRALGSRPQVEVSTWPEPMPVKVGDRFVVCSDGLYDRIEDIEIRDVVMSQDATNACDTLINMARERGGYDNITVGIVSLGAPASVPASTPATRELEALT
jgi:PPM family protein phosphatase